MSIAEKLLTAEEYAELPDLGIPTELVQGRIIEVTPAMPRHGQICFQFARLLDSFAEKHNLGHVVVNDSAVITQRDPDTVRGADVAYYSFEQYPPGPLPNGYLELPPRIAVEVRSPSDRWTEIQEKAIDYLNANVLVVLLLDPADRTVRVFRQTEGVIVLTENDVLRLPELHDDFSASVKSLFSQ